MPNRDAESGRFIPPAPEDERSMPFIVKLLFLTGVIIAVLMFITGRSESQGLLLPDDDIVGALGLASGDTLVATTGGDHLTIRLDFRGGGFVDEMWRLNERPMDSEFVLAGDVACAYLITENFGMDRYCLELPEGVMQPGYIYLGEKLLMPILRQGE